MEEKYTVLSVFFFFFFLQTICFIQLNSRGDPK